MIIEIANNMPFNLEINFDKAINVPEYEINFFRYLFKKLYKIRIYIIIRNITN